VPSSMRLPHREIPRTRPNRLELGIGHPKVCVQRHRNGYPMICEDAGAERLAAEHLDLAGAAMPRMGSESPHELPLQL
jgi:hypothetical protein